MSAPSPVNGVVALLRADAGVAALAATRVFGADGVPRSENASMPRAAIVVSGAGGYGAFGRAYQAYSDKRVDVACYGLTQHASYELFLEVARVMKAIRRDVVAESADQSIVLHWSRVSADGVTAKDPVTGWPMTLASYQVLASEVAVPA